MIEKINSDESDGKWLIFQSNKQKAQKLQKSIKPSVAFVSAEEKEFDTMKSIIENNSFEEKVLITTKVLDNGISLHDKKIQNIVLETTSETEFIQMLGRRRFAEGDQTKLNIFIPKLSKGYFGTLLRRKIYPALELLKLEQHQIIAEAFKDEDVYKICKSLFDYVNGKFILNEMGKNQLIEKEKFYKQMEDALAKDPNAFVKLQLCWLGKEEEMENVVFCRVLKQQKNMEALKMLLKQNVEQMLGKDDQKVFREKMKDYLQVLLPEKFVHKSRVPGLSTMNEAFRLLEIDYYIVSISGKKKGEETQWMITKKEL